MSELVRFISEDGQVVACAINSTDIVAKIEKIHKTSAVVTAAIGRLSTAGSMMGYMLKNKTDSLTIRMNGGGPTGTLMVVADYMGNIKSFVKNPIVELPLNKNGKLDVASAIGVNGILSISKDLSLKEPYVGQVSIISGEIAEDITHYYATSEQTPTVCALGVLVNEDLTPKAAGGYLLQLLPFASEECISQIEKNIKKIPPISTAIKNGMTPSQICEILLEGMSPSPLDSNNIEYKCDCSHERAKKAIISLGDDEINQIIAEDNSCEIICDFCNMKYNFSKDELISFLKDKKDIR